MDGYSIQTNEAPEAQVPGLFALWSQASDGRRVSVGAD